MTTPTHDDELPNLPEPAGSFNGHELFSRGQLLDYAREALAASPASIAQTVEGQTELTSAIEAVADFLEEKANLGIISQFTAIQQWIDASRSEKVTADAQDVAWNLTASIAVGSDGKWVSVRRQVRDEAVRLLRSSAEKVTADAGAQRHLTGHSSLAEMVSTHIHTWREALGALFLNKAYDRSYIEYEQKALAAIENACKVEMAHAALAHPSAAKVAQADAKGVPDAETRAVLNLCIIELSSWMHDHGQDLRSKDAIKRARALIAARTPAAADTASAEGEQS